MSGADERVDEDVGAWQRLKPRTRNEQADEGTAAPVADPAWLLARQWQTGEFQGEDAGSPVDVRVETVADRLTRFHAGRPAGDGDGDGDGNAQARGRPYDPSTTPLEALVEREAVTADDGTGTTDRRRAAVDGGLLFRRLLGDAYPGRDAFAPAFHLDPAGATDDETARFDAVVAGRVLDGRALVDACRPLLADDGDGPDPVAPALLVDAGGVDEAAYREAAAGLVEWYDGLYSEPAAGESCWDDDRLSYAFALGARRADGESVLVGDEYVGGRLDWYAVDRTDQGLGTPPEDRASTTRETHALPTRVSFPGAPSPRLFQLEDGATNLARLSPTRDSVASALLVEFVYRFGHDWYALPVEAPVGSMVDVTELTVRNTFGDVTRVGRYGEVDDEGAPARDEDDRWRLFEIEPAGTDTGAGLGTTPGLLVMPTLVASLESDAVETVEFARDEMANLGWAIERAVEGPLGRSIDRHEDEAATARADQAPTDGPTDPAADPAYRLTSGVPDYWYPMVPFPDAAGENRLRRGRLAAYGDEPIPDPLGRVLADPGFALYEEEVPRSGVTVERGYQLARWIDGRSVLWASRSVTAGYGGQSSGLEYDALSE